MKGRRVVIGLAALVLLAPMGVGPATGAELPGAPRNVSWSVVDVRENDGDIDLSWQAPVSDGGSPITAYDIQQTKDGQWIDLYTLRSASQWPTLQINELPRGAVYRLRVAAVTDVGRGPWTETGDVGIRTTPSAPRDVAWSVSPAGNLTITWQPPANTGGPLPPGSPIPSLWTYTLYASEDGVAWRPDLAVRAQDPRQILASRYRVGDRYYFRMTASNEWGEGPPSAATPLFAPTEARPGPVTNLRITFRTLTNGKVAAALSWTPGASGGLPQKFSLFVSVNGQDRIKYKRVASPRFTVGNIPPKDSSGRPTKVFMSVRAENTKYDSPDLVTKEAYVPQ